MYHKIIKKKIADAQIISATAKAAFLLICSLPPCNNSYHQEKLIG